MEQLTLRDVGNELADKIKQVAKERAVPLDQAALLLLRRGAGLSERAHERIGHDLDHPAGAWRDDEAEAFLRTLEPLDTPGESLWS